MPINDIQSVNKQHAVPQNIMDVEFKIIGELTMRQFAYVMAFGGLAFVSATYVAGFFKWPFAIFFTLLGLAFAFVPIEDRGMDQWVVAFFRAVYSPTQKVWRKEAVVPSVFFYQNMDVLKRELITLAPTSSRRKLEEYLDHQHESGPVDKLDIREDDFIRKVKDAYSAPMPIYSNPVAVAVAEDTTPQFIPDVPTASSANPPIVDTLPVESVAPVTAVPLQSGFDSESISVGTQKSYDTTIVPIKKARRPTDDIKPVKKKIEEKEFKLVDRSKVGSGDIVTHDTHTGRKFTNLLATHGEIVLPIRGERVIQTIEEVDIDKEISDKTNQLKSLIDKIKKEEGITTSDKAVTKKLSTVPNDFPSVAPVLSTSTKPLQESPKGVTIELGASELPQAKEDFDIEANAVIETVKTQNKKLQNEIEKLRSQLFTKNPDQTEEKQKIQKTIRDLEDSKTRTETEYSALQKQLVDLQDRLKEKETISVAPISVKSQVSTSSLPVAPTKPNILSGVVLDSKGVAIEGVVLIVKNNKGEARRATKTNALGQFSLISPLPNGLYSVEVGQYNKVSQTFDIISVEVKGDIVAPLVFQGKQA